MCLRITAKSIDGKQMLLLPQIFAHALCFYPYYERDNGDNKVPRNSTKSHVKKTNQMRQVSYI